MSATVNLSQNQREHGNFIKKIYEESGIDVRRCYQCGKCSGSCPVHNSKGMDYSPNRILRMIQLGMEEEVLDTRTIWACVLCSTCTARCPRDIDVPRVMDALRIMAKKRGIINKFKNANVFHDVFMDSIVKHGRVYELGLLIGLKLKQSGTLFEELDIGLPAMLSAGLRIPKLPPKVNNPDEIRKIVENCKRMEGEK